MTIDEFIGHQLAHIDAVYETVYVGKSLVVTRDAFSLHHVGARLIASHYPVKILTISNAMAVLDSLESNGIRMILVDLPCILKLPTDIMDFLLTVVDVVFVDGRLESVSDHIIPSHFVDELDTYNNKKQVVMI
jgi:hypothetical protein